MVAVVEVESAWRRRWVGGSVEVEPALPGARARVGVGERRGGGGGQQKYRATERKGKRENKREIERELGTGRGLVDGWRLQENDGRDPHGCD